MISYVTRTGLTKSKALRVGYVREAHARDDRACDVEGCEERSVVCVTWFEGTTDLCAQHTTELITKLADVVDKT
jgi:hypothetical protein